MPPLSNTEHFEKQKTQAALRASEARTAAVLDVALDCIVTIDHLGRVVDWNPAAERTFGYSRTEAFGQEMAALIIPAALRERHRLGLSRAVATGENSIIGQRIEITAQRADGTEFPVELAVTRISTDGPPLFTGHIRDITARKQAEQRQAAQYAVARVLAEAGSLDEAAPKILQVVCEGLQWDIGVIWHLDSQREVLHCVDIWHGAKPELKAFAELTRQSTFARAMGLPGRIWATAEPCWIPDVVEDSNFPRAALAAREGLHSAFGFPIHLGDQALGVIEFFSDKIRQPDVELLNMFAAIGSQMGQFIKRTRAEAEFRQLNAELECRIAASTAELRTANEQEQQRVQETLRRHRALLGLAQLGALDFKDLLRHILAEDAGALKVERISFWSMDRTQTGLDRQGLFLLSKKAFTEQADHIEARDYGHYFAALTDDLELIVANDCCADRRLQEFTENYFKPLGITSTLDAPVHLNGKLFGVIWHEHVGPARAWTADDIDFTRAIAQMVALAIETSERKRAEARSRESQERFSKAFRASPVSVSIARLSDGCFVEVNEVFVKSSGYSLPEIIGRTSSDLDLWVEPEERQKFLRKLQADGFIHGYEARLRNNAGRIATLLLSAELIEIEGAPHILNVSLDISARKQVEEELQNAFAREKELSLLKSNFVTLVSHEFRTPLGIIMSAAEILDSYLERLSTEKRREHLHDIHQATRQMSDLMEEVLLLGRVEAGKMQFKPETLDVRDLCERLVETVASATNSRCPIEFRAKGMAERARGDEALLRHIFTNLLSNGVKYSPPGRSVLFTVERQNHEAVFHVRDRGIGIPEEDLKHLFQAFHRGGNVGELPGSGLGLLIVQRCVELHGGQIDLASKLGEGTMVTVRLPLFAGKSKVQSPKSKVENSKSKGRRRPKSKVRTRKTKKKR